MSKNTVSGTLFNCHTCARWSHPVLTFLTFHENDFATIVPTVLFTRNCFGSWLFVVTILFQICLFIHLPILVWIDWKI